MLHAKKTKSCIIDRPTYVKNMNKIFITIIIILNFVLCVNFFSFFVGNIYINLRIF